MAGKKVQFEVHAGAPIRLDITGADGKPYEARLQLAIFEVEDTGTSQDTAVGKVPVFSFGANIVVDVKPKAATGA